MKKLIFVLAALFTVFTVSAKTYTNNIGVGLRVPLYASMEQDKAGTPKVEYWPGGIDVQYLGYFENGFSLKGNVSLSMCVTKINDDNWGCVAVSERIGAGYGLIRTEKMYLGLFGFLGCDWTYFAQVDTTNVKSNTVTASQISLGGDATFIFTPKRIFSLYASLAMGGAFGSAESKTELSSGSSISNKDDLKPAFVMYPSVGISWKF